MRTDSSSADRPGLSVSQALPGVLCALLLASPLAGCAPHLDIGLHSFPPGARVIVDGTEHGGNTPAFISREFPPPETVEGIHAYHFEVQRDGRTARGRLLCSAAPGGVRTDWQGRLLIHTVESMDGSAWIIPQQQLVEARFPEPGRSFLVIRWWQSFRRSSFRLDGKDVQSTGDWMQLFSLPAGPHELTGIDWTVPEMNPPPAVRLALGGPVPLVSHPGSPWYIVEMLGSTSRSQSDCSPTIIVFEVPSMQLAMLTYSHGGNIPLAVMMPPGVWPTPLRKLMNSRAVLGGTSENPPPTW